MDPLYDLVRDRTQDLRRTAEAARRERELRGSTPHAQDQRSNTATTVAPAADPCAGPCLPAGTVRAA